METSQLVQGSTEWKMARVGSLGASQVHKVMAKTKSGPAASRANVMAEIIAERLTGTPTESYQNAIMQWGLTTEPDARAAYEFRSSRDVSECGLFIHPTIAKTHASPDGLVGSDGLLEIKCPLTATHIDTLLGKPISGDYITQIQWQIACANRKWCDFVSFDPRLPETMRLFVQRVHRNDSEIKYMEREVTAFLIELDEKLTALTSKFGSTETKVA